MFQKTAYIFFVLTFFLFGSFSLTAQSAKQKQLETKRKEILLEIKQINALLSQSKSESKSILVQVEDLNLKIRATQHLIRITNDQANLLTREVSSNIKKIKTLEEELRILKEDYAKMIVKANKSKKQDSKLMFLLSSDDFLQAYKRLQYLKQYTAFRKQQGDSIVSKKEQLKVINESLAVQKKDKDRLIVENKATQKTLVSEKKQQQKLVNALKKDEKKYVAQINKKQKEANKIDKEIDKLIRDAIAKSKPNNTKGTSFVLTKEAKLIGNNFKSNKGRLPWPVLKGIKTKRYGKQRHPTLPNVTTFNSGVEITAEPHAEARAVFKGKVLAIQTSRGTNKTVLIQHGSYITAYFNLKKVYIKKGQEVDIKDVVGIIGENPETNKTTLKFAVFENAKRLNPEDWIFKM